MSCDISLFLRKEGNEEGLFFLLQWVLMSIINVQMVLWSVFVRMGA